MSARKTAIPEKERLQLPEKPLMEQGSALVSIEAHALRHRIPTWQKAALLRFMNWEEDKQVSSDEFAAALKSLQNRRIGGGRK